MIRRIPNQCLYRKNLCSAEKCPKCFFCSPLNCAILKMDNRYFLLTLLVIFNKTIAKPTEIKCPEYCNCDLYENLRRATCQNKNLYSIETGVSSYAEILDLSYNQISELGDKIFLEIGLTQLKLLNLTHNKVSQIHFNGFEGLANLKTLDLSFNAIRYFLKSWFYSLNSLEELYLKGNNLKSINEEPLIDIKSLRILDISDCSIIHLRPKIFKGIPNLEILDISGNFLTHLKPDVITSLSKLLQLNAKDNNFVCKDKTLNRLRNYIKSNGIAFYDSCSAGKRNSQKHLMFEKIVMSGATLPSEKNSWLFDEEEERLKNTKIVEVCSDTGNGNITQVPQSLIMQIIELSPWLSFTITLTFGVLLGLVIGCSVQLRPKNKNDNNEDCTLPDGVTNLRSTRSLSGSKKLLRGEVRTSVSNFRPRSKSSGSRRYLRDDGDSLMMSEFDLAYSTPVNSRKTFL